MVNCPIATVQATGRAQGTRAFRIGRWSAAAPVGAYSLGKLSHVLSILCKTQCRLSRAWCRSSCGSSWREGEYRHDRLPCAPPAGPHDRQPPSSPPHAATINAAGAALIAGLAGVTPAERYASVHEEFSSDRMSHSGHAAATNPTSSTVPSLPWREHGGSGSLLP